jgi:hypothetical protein
VLSFRLDASATKHRTGEHPAKVQPPKMFISKKEGAPKSKNPLPWAFCHHTDRRAEIWRFFVVGNDNISPDATPSRPL